MHLKFKMLTEKLCFRSKLKKTQTSAVWALRIFRAFFSIQMATELDLQKLEKQKVLFFLFYQQILDARCRR